MITGRSRWRAAVAGALLAGCAAGSPPPAALPATSSVARPYVVMLSLDAFRHDYIERFRPPALSELATRGVRASALVPVFPSKTFPNHYTLVTGLYPGEHGIVGNAFYDPAFGAWYRLNDTLSVRDARWYGGEPIWVTAERQGVRTGAYFWAGSEAAVGGVRPAHFTRYDARIPNDRRVDSVIAWLRLPAASRPHLALLYFSDVDDTTHRYGPDAPQTALAVASVDRAVRRLLDGIATLPIRDSVNVVVVSDHGMTAVSPERVIPVFDALVAAGVDTTGVLASDNGPTMSLWFRGDASRLAAAEAALRRAVTQATVYRRATAPARFHLRDNPRAGDLLLVATPGWTLMRRGSDKPPRGGAHGFDPAVPDMHGIFIAAGPNVRAAGVVPALENVNVYEFLAALLRLARVARTDGTGAALPYVR